MTWHHTRDPYLSYEIDFTFLMYENIFMNVKTAVRTLEFFERFAIEQRPIRLSELAAVLKAPISSCFQLVGTLQRLGYAYALADKSYYPTKRMLRHAELIATKDPVLTTLGPVLATLRDKTGESVILGTASEGKAMILDVFESPHRIRYTARPGELREIHASSLGKALLGTMSPAERDACLPREPYVALTSATITTRSQLDSDLAESAARGWYQSLSEGVPELHAVSAPVHFAGGVFSISVAGPITRFTPHMHAHVKALITTVRKIESLDTDKSAAKKPGRR